MKELLENENEYYKKTTGIQEEQINTLKKEIDDYKEINKKQAQKLIQYKLRIDKAKAKLTAMFNEGNEETVLDDLLELDRILGDESNE